VELLLLILWSRVMKKKFELPAGPQSLNVTNSTFVHYFLKQMFFLQKILKEPFEIVAAHFQILQQLQDFAKKKI
jgi:hypothetical protein